MQEIAKKIKKMQSIQNKQIKKTQLLEKTFSRPKNDFFVF